MNNDVKVIKSALSDRFLKNGQAPRGRVESGLKNRTSADYSHREIEMSRRMYGREKGERGKDTVFFLQTKTRKTNVVKRYSVVACNRHIEKRNELYSE